AQGCRVFQEVRPLLRPLSGVLDLPEAVAGERRGDDRRGQRERCQPGMMPAASRPPAPIWTRAFTLTAVRGSAGATGTAPATFSTTGLAIFALGSGFFSTSIPPAMKTPASMGRAIARMIFTF